MIYRLLFSFSLVVMAFIPSRIAYAEAYDPNWYNWLQYPWEVRYVLLASGRYQDRFDMSHRRNQKKDIKGSPDFRDYEELFRPVFPFKDEGFSKDFVGANGDEFNNNYGELGVQIVEFDRNGKVLTANRSLQPLTGRQVLDGERVRVASLVAGEGKSGDYWFLLGDWFEGFPSGDGKEFAPALCHPNWDDGRYALNSSERYFHPERKFKRKTVEESIGLFGCREWGYQLYHRPVAFGLQERPGGRPYIDVTSYGGKRGEKTRIGDFLGWAGFDDPPRPVIGKHGKYWVCLHECPDGEKPGLIPDINAWVSKRGWPLPKPMPSFPDSRFKNPYVAENPE
jgi:hypothetical protein